MWPPLVQSSLDPYLNRQRISRSRFDDNKPNLHHS